ncbi:major capsid protein [Neisseria yangbaofengii]|uniref:major capsid protein n=1 Tax=Neisseria yangbaofengii TaxID=2709396 RepID=UPI0013EDA40B|nr:major capsid protein [Neisseria yangbaofengii]
MNFINVCRKYGQKAALAAPLLTVGVAAHAALPEAAKTAISNGSADASEAGWLVIGALAAIFAIKLVKRFF